MLHHFCDVKFQAVESVRHLTEQVFHLLLQDSELPVKVDAALALQFLVKYQVLCEWEGGGGAVEGLVGGVLGRECYLGGVCICCDTVMRDTYKWRGVEDGCIPVRFSGKASSQILVATV